MRQKLGAWIATQPKEDLEALRELLEAGKVTPVADRTSLAASDPGDVGLGIARHVDCGIALGAGGATS